MLGIALSYKNSTFLEFLGSFSFGFFIEKKAMTNSWLFFLLYAINLIINFIFFYIQEWFFLFLL